MSATNSAWFGLEADMLDAGSASAKHQATLGQQAGRHVDVYFSADVETDGPIPGPYSILSLALVYAGRFDGSRFVRPEALETSFYKELRPISDEYQADALKVNGLNRDRLLLEGEPPERAMTEAAHWVRQVSGSGQPVLVAYPLSFDWAWLYWYFVRFASGGSPFDHSKCFDVKTAYAVKARVPIVRASRSQLMPALKSTSAHTHHALDDAKEQADIFAKIMEWEGNVGGISI